MALRVVKRSTHKVFEGAPVEKYTYSTGATFLYHSFPNIKRCHLSVGFLVGSFVENETEHGLAHLLEHLFFRAGGIRYPSLISDIEMLGGDINAYTSHDMMVFELVCLARDLDKLAPLFFSLFESIDLPEDEFEKEKQVVIQELKEEEGDDELWAEEQLMIKHFGKQYGHPIGGTVKSVSSLTLKQAKSFFKKYFKPSRMVVVALTPDDGKTIKKIVRKFLATTIDESTPMRMHQLRLKKSKVAHINKNFDKKTDSPLVLFSFNSPKLNAPERGHMLVLDQLLCDGMSSILFKTLREKNALVYGYSSSINAFAWGGNYTISINSEIKKLDEIEKLVKLKITELVKNPLSDKLLKQQIEKLLRFWELHMDDLESRADFMLRSELFRADFNGLSELEANLNKVTVSSFSQFVSNMIESDYSVIQIR